MAVSTIRNDGLPTLSVLIFFAKALSVICASLTAKILLLSQTTKSLAIFHLFQDRKDGDGYNTLFVGLKAIVEELDATDKFLLLLFQISHSAKHH